MKGTYLLNQPVDFLGHQWLLGFVENKPRNPVGLAVVRDQFWKRNIGDDSGIIWSFNIAMEAMAHRNRWFTVLKNGWIFPWQTVSHNQLVTFIIIIYHH